MKLNLRYVSDIIGDDYKNWQMGDVILIDAQTGTGKNYFIENILLPYAVKNNKKILYLCNRVPLKGQTKLSVAKMQGIDIDKDINVDQLEHIGNVSIVSYHSLQNLLTAAKTLKKQEYERKLSEYYKYDFTVFDECHYLLHDSSFNNKRHSF